MELAELARISDEPLIKARSVSHAFGQHIWGSAPSRLIAALTGVLAVVSVASGQLRIVDIEAAHGSLGPARNSLDVYPYDELFFRYRVEGAGINEEGKLNCELSITVTDSQGSTVLEKTEAIGGLLALGAESFAGSAATTLNERAEPGPYVLGVRVTDRLRNEEAAFKRTFRLRPAQFAIVSPRFSYDEQGRIAAPVGGHLGQRLYVQLRVIGVDRTKGRIDTLLEIEVLDSDGNVVNSGPIRSEMVSKNLEVVERAPYVKYSGQLTLNRTGRFVLRLRVTDRAGQKTATFETPLRVVPPAAATFPGPRDC